jgi:hypothetical protein
MVKFSWCLDVQGVSNCVLKILFSQLLMQIFKSKVQLRKQSFLNAVTHATHHDIFSIDYLKMLWSPFFAYILRINTFHQWWSGGATFGMLLIFHTFRTKIIDVHFLIVSGRAVFATRSFQKGNFLLVYGGELITDEEANAREQRDRENVPIYRYFFRFNSKCFW